MSLALHAIITLQSARDRRNMAYRRITFAPSPVFTFYKGHDFLIFLSEVLAQTVRPVNPAELYRSGS